MNDLSTAYLRKDLATTILKAIDNYAVATYDGGFRSHLGASVIGAECTRATWYGFRWMGRMKANGRMQRLFQRGHLEEHRFVEYLRGIGATVWPEDPATGKQFRVAQHGGHFGGSLDGIARLPEQYGYNAPVLTEYKTKGTGSGFVKLKADGIMMTNPQHYDQMCVYGMHYKLEYALYMSVNKNDDDMHVELVPLNVKRAQEVESKALYIIRQQTPPPRLSINPSHFKCKSCDFLSVCHENAVPPKNCRSCQYAQPVDDAKWYCSGHGAQIPESVVPTGCPQWDFLKSPAG